MTSGSRITGAVQAGGCACCTFGNIGIDADDVPVLSLSLSLAPALSLSLSLSLPSFL